MIKIATAFSGGFGSVEFALKYLEIEHEVVFACEWMKPQRESYILNHGEPTSNFYEDIRELDGNKYKGDIDYYHLSPPCQSYSLAGSRGGAADERGGLMFEAIKSIDQVQPKMFSIENVKGLLSSNGGEDFKNIMNDLKSLGNYTISYGVMNAKEQGTPQNRERVFIVGFRGYGAKFSFPKRVELKKVLRDVLEDEISEKYFLSDKSVANFLRKDANENNAMKIQAFHDKDDKACAALTARYHKCGITDPYIKESINKIGFINQDTQASQVIGIDGVSSSLCAGTHGYAKGYIKEELIQLGNIDQQGHDSLWGRVYSPDGIAPTQNAKGGGAGAKTGLFKVSQDIKDSVRKNFIRDYDEIVASDKKVFYSECEIGFQDNKVCLTESACLRANNKDTFTLDKEMRIRRLTPRECARVQGDFQDMFKFGNASDTKLYEFIGNAMDISTTKNLIKKMIEHLENVALTEPKDSTFTISKSEQQLNLFELMGA